MVHYLVTARATESAIVAGYSRKSAPGQAQRLLKDEGVQKAIAAHQAAAAASSAVNIDQVLREAKALAFSRIDHYEVDDDGRVKLAEGAPDDAMAAVQSIKYRVRTDEDGAVTRETELKLWDKIHPLSLVGKHVGLFNDSTLERMAKRAIEAMMAKELNRLAPDERKEFVDVDASPLGPNEATEEHGDDKNE